MTGRRGQTPRRVDVSLHESWLPREHALYRPRHSGKQRTARVCAAVFFLVPLLGLAIFGPAPALENHPKAPFPSLSQGWGFFTGLGPWAVDNLSFRQSAVQLTNGISRSLFGEPAPLGQGNSAVGALPQGASAPPTQPVQPGPQQDPTSDGYPEVIYGTDNWLYFGYDIQGKCEPQQPLSTVVANLTKLKNAIETSGRGLVLFVVPDKSSVEGQHLPADYVGKDCATEADRQFWPAMDAFGATDPRPEINQASQQTGQPVYFPLGTHWTYTGGLIMVREIAEQIQPGVSSTWKLTKGPVHTGAADLPPLVAQTGTESSNIYHLAPDGRANRDNQQVDTNVLTPVTISAKNPVTGMVTTPTTMIGDSFTEYGAPLLPAAFSDLTYTNVETAAADPAAEAGRMVASKVIVLEVVERNLIAGVSPFTSDGFIDTISAQLAAHPLH